MLAFQDATIIVFAKAPEPGKVKTRLTSQLSPEHAARLHQQLVLRTLDMTTQASIAKIELWCAPNSRHAFFQYCQQHYPISLYEQVGGDLGQRMQHAIDDALARSQYCLIIGTDCPALSRQHLADTFSSLMNGHDCVITPATDGGYVMLGLKKTSPELFTDIEWGSNSVYKETTNRLNSLSWRWQSKTALNDIDRPDDLVLLQDIDLPTPLSP